MTRVRRGAMLGAVCALLSGCAATGPGGTSGTGGTGDAGGGLFAVLSTVSRPVGDPLPQAPIAGGDIVVRGPTGYCVDGKSLRNQASGGFALLASCYVMTGGHQGANVSPAVMTVAAARSASGDRPPTPAELAAALGDVEVMTATQRRGLTILRIAEGGDRNVPDADPRHWRGAMVLNGYLVILGVYGPENGEMAGQGGSALMVELAASLRASVPRKVAGAPAAKTARNSPAGNGGTGGARGSILDFLR